MNCLEFRRLAQADPYHFPPAAQTHLETCAACQEFVARMRQVNDTVAGTLNQVVVPDGLAERILLRTSKAPGRALATMGARR